MASTAIPPHDQPRAGENKQKNVAGEGRNRRVLKDIGNLVVAKQADPGAANVSKRVTRTQLLAVAQAAAEKNKKSSTELVNGTLVAANGAGVGNFIAAKKVELAQKAAEHEVIVISSDDESEEKKETRAVRGRKMRERSARKNAKAFSSVLSARSKAACGLVPKDLVVNIDATDMDNELAATEYIDDIYKFYKLTEDDGCVHDYMASQPDINAKMRSILVDWLIEVHRKFELMPETFYLALNIIDRFLSTKPVSRKELQLVGISSMLIASKYEEIWAPEVNDFVCISDNAYVREQVLVMEKTILRNLEWYLTVPTPYVFLVRYIKASTPFDREGLEKDLIH